MQKKDDKVGNKTVNKEERQRKKQRAREKSKFWLLHMCEKQESCLITSDWSENMPLFLQNSFLATLMLISRKLVQRRRIGEKCGVFFWYFPAVTKGLT